MRPSHHSRSSIVKLLSTAALTVYLIGGVEGYGGNYQPSPSPPPSPPTPSLPQAPSGAATLMFAVPSCAQPSQACGFYLDANGGLLRSCPTSAFACYSNRTLDLSFNALSTIPEGAFLGFQNVQILNLRGNPDLSAVPEGVLSLTALKILIVDDALVWTACQFKRTSSGFANAFKISDGSTVLIDTRDPYSGQTYPVETYVGLTCTAPPPPDQPPYPPLPSAPRGFAGRSVVTRIRIEAQAYIYENIGRSSTEVKTYQGCRPVNLTYNQAPHGHLREVVTSAFTNVPRVSFPLVMFYIDEFKQAVALLSSSDVGDVVVHDLYAEDRARKHLEITTTTANSYVPIPVISSTSLVHYQALVVTFSVQFGSGREGAIRAQLYKLRMETAPNTLLDNAESELLINACVTVLAGYEQTSSVSPSPPPAIPEQSSSSQGVTDALAAASPPPSSASSTTSLPPRSSSPPHQMMTPGALPPPLSPPPQGTPSSMLPLPSPPPANGQQQQPAHHEADSSQQPASCASTTGLPSANAEVEVGASAGGSPGTEAPNPARAGLSAAVVAAIAAVMLALGVVGGFAARRMLTGNAYFQPSNITSDGVAMPTLRFEKLEEGEGDHE